MKVAVVGGGVMGSATAWQLSRRGVDVVLHEQFGPGHDRGSSHGGSRIFRFAYDDPEYVRMAMAALTQWRELEAVAGEPLLDITGGVDHGPAVEIERLSAVLHAVGVTHDVLPGADAADRFPGMRFDERALVHPDGGRCRPDATVAALQRLVDTRYESPVDDIRALDADVVVVAAGAWLPKLLPDVDLPPLVVTKEQKCHFTPREPSIAWPSFIHRQADGVGIYGLETPGEGVKVAAHHIGPVVDPDTRDFELEPEGIERMVRHVEEWFPGLDPTPVFPATCLYTNTPNEDFLLDRVGDVVVVSPCSGHGFKFAPEIGRLAADLALGAAPEHERFTIAAHKRWRGTVRHL
jgi:sarcosine oxidase